jgi:hypothetical protein
MVITVQAFTEFIAVHSCIEAIAVALETAGPTAVACFLGLLSGVGLAVEPFLQHRFMEEFLIAFVFLSNDSFEILNFINPPNSSQIYFHSWLVLTVLAFTVFTIFPLGKTLTIHLQTFGPFTEAIITLHVRKRRVKFIPVFNFSIVSL